MEKTCTKCFKTFPADTVHFYRNKGGKFGLTPRCKKCTNEDNNAWRARKMKENPEELRKQASERTKRYYRKNIEENRKKHREWAKKRRNDLGKNLAIKIRKRAGGAGLTPEQWESIFDKQGRRCAICKSSDPYHAHGWNTDHCHKTKKVRFILCAHCNRGLGAFRDDPNLMRRAADMLEEITENTRRAAILEKG